MIKKIFNSLNLNLTRYKKSPFEFLLSSPRYEEMTIQLNNESFRIADSLSFYWSYREIFIDEIYKFKTKNDSPFIIDCGSNYGTSILYFKKLYPNANIIGIEADPYIFKILEGNILKSSYKDIQLYNSAISNTDGFIDFYIEGADGGRTHNNSQSKKTVKVKTVNLDNIINKEVDFLKMDIEGAETDVLCELKNLKKVKQLFIEYHSFSDSKQVLGHLLSTLTENGFRYYIHTQFSSKQPLIKTELQLGMDSQLNIFAKRI